MNFYGHGVTERPGTKQKIDSSPGENTNAEFNHVETKQDSSVRYFLTQVAGVRLWAARFGTTRQLTDRKGQGIQETWKGKASGRASGWCVWCKEN
jgi:hypothetical protein